MPPVDSGVGEARPDGAADGAWDGVGVGLAQPGAMVIVWSLVAVNPSASVTTRVKSKVPVAVGVPLIAPSVASVSPGGRLPVSSAQVSGGAFSPSIPP